MTDEPVAGSPLLKRTYRSLIGAVVMALLGTAVWAANFALVGHRVSSAVSDDARNGGYRLSGHYASYLDPTTIVLDLRSAAAAAPIDLFRGLFQSAAALREVQPQFSR